MHTSPQLLQPVTTSASTTAVLLLLIHLGALLTSAGVAYPSALTVLMCAPLAPLMITLTAVPDVRLASTPPPARTPHLPQIRVPLTGAGSIPQTLTLILTLIPSLVRVRAETGM